MTTDFISVVLPAYNESSTIVACLTEFEHYLVRSGNPWEIIVVDDGSPDETFALANQYLKQSRNLRCLRVLRNPMNRGKGFSVRRGFLESTGNVVLFSDIDLSTPIDEATKLLFPIQAGRCDAAFGSRALPESRIEKHQPPLRDMAGKCFNLLVQLIAGLRFKDTQCGFKAFRRELFVPVFQRQRIERFGFDVEILYLARKRGLRLAEVPVRWRDSPNTKVRFLCDASNMFMDLWRIRANDLLGRYD